jgi:hypothetical protein
MSEKPRKNRIEEFIFVRLREMQEHSSISIMNGAVTIFVAGIYASTA